MLVMEIIHLLNVTFLFEINTNYAHFKKATFVIFSSFQLLYISSLDFFFKKLEVFLNLRM